MSEVATKNNGADLSLDKSVNGVLSSLSGHPDLTGFLNNISIHIEEQLEKCLEERVVELKKQFSFQKSLIIIRPEKKCQIFFDMSEIRPLYSKASSTIKSPNCKL